MVFVSGEFGQKTALTNLSLAAAASKDG
jgi:hypothetical protein